MRRDRQVVENLPDSGDVVGRPLHRGSDVGEDDRRHVAMDADRLAQVLQVDPPVRRALDHDVPHVEAAENLADRVVGVFRIVDQPVGKQLAAEKDAVHVAFGAAVGYIPPDIAAACAGQRAERVEHFAFEHVGVQVEVAGHERVADVVDRERKEAEQVAVVEVRVAGVADEVLRFLPQGRVEVVEPPSALAIEGRRCRRICHSESPWRIGRRGPAGRACFRAGVRL